MKSKIGVINKILNKTGISSANSIDMDLYNNVQQLTIDGGYEFKAQKITNENEELFIAFNIQAMNNCINRATIITPKGEQIAVDFRDKPKGIYVPFEKGEYHIACWMNMAKSSFKIQ